MSALDVQEILARLYTDEMMRAEFLADRDRFCRQLASEEADFIRQIDEKQLEFFANSLKSKRANEAAKLLPLTRAALGQRFYDEFCRYAQSSIPSGEKKHVADAMAFCEHLIHRDCSLDHLTSEAARFELLSFRPHFKLKCEAGHPRIYQAARSRMWSLRLARFAYELPALDGCEEIESARARVTLVLFAKFAGLGGIWYWTRQRQAK